MVAEPLQYVDWKGGWGGQKSSSGLLYRWRSRRHLGERLGTSVVVTPSGVCGIGEQDADALDDHRPARHALVVGAERQSPIHQVDLKWIGDARVIAKTTFVRSLTCRA